MGDSGIDPVLMVYPAKVGDFFLLCSDGLSSVLTDQEIKAIIETHSGEELLGALLAATKSAGAPDNVTIIWAEVVSEDNSGHTYLIGAANE
jgi:protein phosphatase